MPDIQLTSPAARLTVACGTTPAERAAELFPDNDPARLLACTANGVLAGLHAPLRADAVLAPVGPEHPAAAAIRRRSLCFALAATARRLFPGRRLAVGHAIGQGYYYRFADGVAAAEDCAALAAALAERLARREAIAAVRLPWRRALERLEADGRREAAALLRHLHDPEVDCWELDGFLDLDHGALAAYTDQIGAFGLSPQDEGFVLDLPDGGRLAERSPLLFSSYRASQRWGEILGLSTLGQLNDLAADRRIRDFVGVAEALHQRRIAELAAAAAAGGRTRLVLIAGPSSSGKTTFAKKLAIQLAVAGLKPQALSLDDYFVPRDQTPRDESGAFDFEHLRALDVELLNAQLIELFAGGEVEPPRFDFGSGERRPGGHRLRLPPDGVLVVEGIHALNDELTARVPRELKYKIYASALPQLRIDDLNRISSTDSRLLRRLVRDSRYRGYGAEATLERWPSVRRGEERNIFPFQDSADSVFNSALDYEIGVLKPFAQPLLAGVSPDGPWYHEARRLLRWLDFFSAVPTEAVPDDSILREFIGGSRFKY